MNYWLTTHWPAREDEIDKFCDTAAWVSDGKQAVLTKMLPGDMIFIYELKTGKAIIEKSVNRNQTVISRIEGQQGVIALAEITTVPAEVEGSIPETYTDGSKIWWRFKANARVINSNGFISRRSLAIILGYSEQYSFRGFGDQNSGVKQLSADEFAAIHSTFLGSKEDIKTVLNRDRFFGGGVGEGPLHKSLKEFIAAHPEEALEETGLQTIEVEYPFPTGDRIDIVLEDKDGRLVTVEVEVDCDDKELAGPLQCMKYRALIAYKCNRRIAEIRTVLAARSVAKSVQKRCSNYKIEVIEIPTWPSLVP